MVTGTRLDCAVASAGLMRLILANAIHHCRHRTVFQKKLVDQPLMSQVLADLALDAEAATALAFRLCRSFDRASDPHAAAWRRLMTPVTKYWVCKIAPAFAYEAMECLGGNGYVEEGVAARVYRELPLNAIWEGSGNVMCLDVLRALAQDGDVARMVLHALAEEAAGLPGTREAQALIEAVLSGSDGEAHARIAVERLALLAAAAALRGSAPAMIAELFARTRLAGGQGAMFGTIDVGVAEATSILQRALPA